MSFRFCLLCEKFSGDFLICSECDEYLQNSGGMARTAEREGLIITGYYWTRQNGRACSKLTRKLKNENFVGAKLQFEKLIATEILRRIHFQKFQGDIFLVPAPAKISLAEDHAFLWSKKLEALGVGKMANVLARDENDTEQKEKSKSERLEKKVYLREKIDRENMYIFCDDVVTTGATLKAAKIALGNPPHFLCATIFHRLTLQEIEKQDITRHIWQL